MSASRNSRSRGPPAPEPCGVSMLLLEWLETQFNHLAEGLTGVQQSVEAEATLETAPYWYCPGAATLARTADVADCLDSSEKCAQRTGAQREQEASFVRQDQRLSCCAVPILHSSGSSVPMCRTACALKKTRAEAQNSTHTIDTPSNRLCGVFCGELHLAQVYHAIHATAVARCGCGEASKSRVA